MLDRDTRQSQPQYDTFGVPIDPNYGYDDSWGNDEAAPQFGGSPEQAPQQTQPQERSNDDVRYQYWQSQHDQLKNQYDQLQQQNQAMAQQLAKVEQSVNKPAEPEEELFPEPPPAPARPYGFSQQEAMSDPSSESARYMVAMQEHNSVMNQYNMLKSQWLEEKQKDMFNNLQKQQQQTQSEATRRAEVSAQINQVIAGVQQNYGIDYDTAVDFVNTMSDNSSITMDNLFELYKMRKGGSSQDARQPNGRYAPPPQTQQYNPFGATFNPQPSPDFQQRQRAQSVPPTMGVHNAQGAQQQEDPMIAALRATVAQANRNNVF